MAKYMDLLRAHQAEQTAPTAVAKTTESAPSTASQSGQYSHLLSDESQSIEATIPIDSDPQVKPLLINEKPIIESSPKITETPNIIESSDGHEQVSNKQKWLNTCLQLTLDIFSKAQQDEVCSIVALSNFIGDTIHDLSDDHDSNKINDIELTIAQHLHLINDYHEDLSGLVQKSIMMMLYAIKAGMRLKLSNDELRAHTLAAMLHHIGMAQVSSEIRHKKERLNKKEIQSIRQAPKLGHDYLERCDITDACILQTASQATERYDGSGALGLSGSDITWGARLTGVLSMFEALIHYRPYRKRLLPRDAIREIVKNHKKAFDHDMLKALIESISLYPVGTYVQLNSGDVGLVICVHPRLPLRPIVAVSLDLQGKSVPPRQVDLQKHPNLTVERCMYKESLSELSESS